eukprot:3299894-Prymnesium_polylepis.1
MARTRSPRRPTRRSRFGTPRQAGAHGSSKATPTTSIRAARRAKRLLCAPAPTTAPSGCGTHACAHASVRSRRNGR